jgi:hypothetical protein
VSGGGSFSVGVPGNAGETLGGWKTMPNRRNPGGTMFGNSGNGYVRITQLDCSAGYYSVSGSAHCIQCEAGYYCTGGSN